MAKVEVDKFDGMTDFSVWSMKMRAVISHHDLKIAIEKEASGTLSKNGESQIF